MNKICSIQQKFAEARIDNRIVLVLPEFLTTLFYVISASGECVLTEAPNGEELCATVSPDESLVTFKNFDALPLRGRELLKMLPQKTGILISYEQGGDYLTGSQAELFKSVLD